MAAWWTDLSSCFWAPAPKAAKPKTAMERIINFFINLYLARFLAECSMRLPAPVLLMGRLDPSNGAGLRSHDERLGQRVTAPVPDALE